MSESYRRGVVGFWGAVNGRLVERGEESVSALEAQLLYERAVERAVDKVVMDRAGFWAAQKAPGIRKAPRLSIVH
jgi:hypothetical protein